jgi:hypothetical protein
MSIHYTLAVPKKKLKNFKDEDPEVAYALATAAVSDYQCRMLRLSLSSQCERALTLWRDDLLKYDNGSLKMTRTSARHDFSGTNYRSCTLGWLAGIQQKRRADKKFFERVCTEAHEIALRSMGKGKPLDGSQAGNQYSDCEIADRAGIKSDESDEEDADNQTTVPGASQGPKKGEAYLNAIDMIFTKP